MVTSQTQTPLVQAAKGGYTNHTHTQSVPTKETREGNGNHYNILTWKIPWTEELGGLQSMGSHTWMPLE